MRIVGSNAWTVLRSPGEIPRGMTVTRCYTLHTEGSVPSFQLSMGYFRGFCFVWGEFLCFRSLLFISASLLKVQWKSNTFLYILKYWLLLENHVTAYMQTPRIQDWERIWKF